MHFHKDFSSINFCCLRINTVPKFTSILFILLIFFIASDVFAAKTDIVVMRNGDKITCELKELRSGQLRVKTDDMGTIYIEWPKIASIRTRQFFEVELQFGAIYYGALGPAEDSRKMTVTSDSVSNDIYLAFVVRLTPIKDTFIDRLDGSINLGTDYTKASEVFRLNVDGKATHRTKVFKTEISFSSIITDQPEKETSRRNDITWTLTRFLAARWAWGVQTILEQNTESGIDLRLVVGGGMGRRVVQTNSIELSVLVGLNGTREWVTDAENQSNLELPLSTKFAMFVYDNPKTDITTSAIVSPSLTTLGRYRIDIDSKLKRELFTDFNLTFNVYLNYDNKPPNSSAAKVDYGVTISFGYTF